MSGTSLDAAYFDGIFAHDDDPWKLASSDYEAAKFDRTIAAIDDRRYTRALEVGCAHGVLTARLTPLCADLLAIDISDKAIDHARRRVGGKVRFERMAFPGDAPREDNFDLVVLSEVVYYWSDEDIARAGRWLDAAIAPHGRVIAVHFTGETDYPQTGDGAVERLWQSIRSDFTVERSDRTDRYRLDLWSRG